VEQSLDPFTIEAEFLVRSWTVFANHIRPTQSSQHDHPGGRLRLNSRLAMLLFLFTFLTSALLEATAGDQPSGDPNRVVWQNPPPQLSQNALRGLVAASLGGLETGGYMPVIVRLDAGKATEVRALMSSGSVIADQEICQFVLDHWVFNPKATGVYKLPVLLPRGL
jgi:hypothetical protein